MHAQFFNFFKAKCVVLENNYTHYRFEESQNPKINQGKYEAKLDFPDGSETKVTPKNLQCAEGKVRMNIFWNNKLQNPFNFLLRIQSM